MHCEREQFGNFSKNMCTILLTLYIKCGGFNNVSMSTSQKVMERNGNNELEVIVLCDCCSVQRKALR